ncbi:WD repeat-containing protein [Cordyceps fumosorosea ARSEF 2679]|uniref:WD repeat-containing protein n=1 Tax=Cordyceps fumosorosea (strain ARSEF 2679) TaxID=1081104 RepID=A0A162MBZ6_CORFA|nr:WD repeat-containing protein [Cordyceps fumosorosea ARSEF 2679]OAA54030.1 WD repeat-containing protein [Cordyceps fumosorosea ARSEF 2679]
MQTSNPDFYFQSDAANANRARKAAKSGNKNGNPISMKSKLLAAISDPADPNGSILVAESAGFCRRVNLESTETKTTYRGPKAPVTCLAIGGADNKTLYAGCWDKDVWSWDLDTAQPRRKFSGHSDFVKTVICGTLSGKPVVFSGAADKKIMVWDAESGRRMHTLQDPATTMLAVQHLALDPVLGAPDTLVLVSASSDPSIRRWRVSLTVAEQLPEAYHGQPDAERLTVQEHETSVYRLFFDAEDEDADLWTASADGTAKCLARTRSFEAEESLEHGDYVRAVVVTRRWAVTAGRDEDVKVWDRAMGRLYAALPGHFEEITDLVLLAEGAGREPTRVCSVSIDGTIRTWPLALDALDETVRKIKEDAEKAAAGKTEEKEEEVKGEAGMLTAEEEAELAELMDD